MHSVNSGLDIAIKSLGRIRSAIDSNLIIIGKKSQSYEFFKQLASDCGVENYVKFLGFVETDQFKEILSKCFCGINIVKNQGSYSSYTIPGKFLHYIQYLLPAITTKSAGPFSYVLKNEKLGLVIEASEDEFINAVDKIYKNQEEYRRNILGYVDAMQETTIKELIEN